MELVILGEDIDFSIVYIDSDGVPYDPDEVTFYIMKSVTHMAFGPLTYSGDDVVRVSAGKYVVRFTVPEYMTPGYYTAKWVADVPDGTTFVIGADADGYVPISGGWTAYTVDSGLEYVLQDFQVTEPPIVPNEILDPVRLYGTIRESPRYNDLGYGLTDRIFLVGHGTGFNLNDPYQVVNMQEAVNMLGADSTSPLVRGLLEVYNAGARDIWLVAAAPMTEYVPNLEDRMAPRDEWGGMNFYERYYERLIDTYTALESFDYPEILVPLEAPFYDTGDVDFVTQLVDHCTAAFEATGTVRIGIIGTRSLTYGTDDIDAMVNDPRISELDPSKGKFVILVGGEGVYQLPQMPSTHSSSVATAVAAQMATSPLNETLVYKKLSNIVSVAGNRLTDDQVRALARSKVNPAVRTAKGVRGRTYEVVIASDNTMSEEGSDFWSVMQMRLISKIIDRIRGLGRRYLGTIGFFRFQNDIDDFLASLVAQDFIRGYSYSVERDAEDPFQVYVDVAIQPYFAVREVAFTVEVGPG